MGSYAIESSASRPNMKLSESPPYLVDVMSAMQKIQFGALAFLWLAAIILFWIWWVNELHVVSKMRFLVNSVILAWATILPGYYFFFVSRMKRSNRNLPTPSGLRVAMVVTKAPSEPFSLVRETLEAMLAQAYPHDTCLADEDPSPETLAWCKENGVLVSMRRGVSTYHRSTWPRRTKCKEGNLAYFYDTYGYKNYEFVVQLDADQRPSTGYLEAMLCPFIDPRVGYVSAPSICDANKNKSWAARGRLYAEGTLHGSLQAGYNAGWAPLCIGSHYAIRTAALKEIGGLGPELAEDHSTTLMMNAHGWRGVHALDAEAHGDGPLTFENCMVQEYQWSRSLTTILMTVMLKYWRALPGKLRLQFLFAQIWYPCLGLIMLVGYTLPVIALLTGTPWVNVSYIDFFLHKILWISAALITVAWVKRNGWLRPRNSKIVSWETVLFQLARWPWVLMGSVVAVLGVITRRQFQFRITPKGDNVERELPVRVLAPYFFIVITSGLVAILTSDPGGAAGYYYLAIVNSLMYSVVIIVAVIKHIQENPGIGIEDRVPQPRSRQLVTSPLSASTLYLGRTTAIIHETPKIPIRSQFILENQMELER